MTHEEKAIQALNAWKNLKRIAKNPYQDPVGLKILIDLREALHHKSELNEDIYNIIYYIIH